MKFLLFTILIYCAVRCDDVGNNYYVIEMPEEVRDSKKPFKVYWNVPTMQCRSKKIPFDNLYEKYGIIQNDGDKFRGEKITILYEPGLFPAIFKNETSGKYRFRNGGVPQEGSLEEHITVFKKDMDQIVPDPNFSGIGIIDFESWRPVFRQNFGTLVPYKDVSYEIEKKLHWWWPKPWIQTEARQRFETAARRFMQTTLSIAKQMRPKALWGYYGFPHCFNTPSVNNIKENCPNNVMGENDVTYWLWSESTALYPSVYSSQVLSTPQLGLLVKGRVEEAHRVRRYNTPILPYFWFRYRDGGFMKEADLNIVLQSLQDSKATGIIIWGSSNDVNTTDKCKKLYHYLETVLGPTISKFVQKINRKDDIIVETPIEINIDDHNATLNSSDIITTTFKTIVNETLNINDTIDIVRKGQIDPEFDWIPPVNYSEDISHNVEEELLKKGYNSTGDRRFELSNLNDSIVFDMVFDALLKSEYAKDNNKQTTRDIQNATTSLNINNTDFTEAPNKKETNIFVTKNPTNFIIPNDKNLNNTSIQKEILINKVKQSENFENKADITETTENNLFSVQENEPIILASEDFSTNNKLENESLTIENTTINDNFIQKDNFTNYNEIQQKNISENYIMNIILDTFLNSINIDDENGQQIRKNEQSTINSTKISEITSTTNIADKINDFLIEESTTVIYSNENFEENKESLQKEYKETVDTIVSNTPFSRKDYENRENSYPDEILNKDSNNLSTEIDEFLIFLRNSTKPDSDMTTENSKEVDSDDFVILVVNLTNSLNSTSYDDLIKNYTFDEQTTLGDSVNFNREVNNIMSTTESRIDISTVDISTVTEMFVTESDKNDYFNDSTEISDTSDSYTTDSSTDHVVPPSSAYGSRFDSMYLYIYSTFIFIRLLYNNMT